MRKLLTGCLAIVTLSLSGLGYTNPVQAEESLITTNIELGNEDGLTKLEVDYSAILDHHEHYNTYQVVQYGTEDIVGSLHIAKSKAITSFLDTNNKVSSPYKNFKDNGGGVYEPYEVQTLDTLLEKHSLSEMSDEDYLAYLATLHPTERTLVEEYHKLEADGGTGNSIVVSLEEDRATPLLGKEVYVRRVALIAVVAVIIIQRSRRENKESISAK